MIAFQAALLIGVYTLHLEGIFPRDCVRPCFEVEDVSAIGWDGELQTPSVRSTRITQDGQLVTSLVIDDKNGQEVSFDGEQVALSRFGGK